MSGDEEDISNKVTNTTAGPGDAPPPWAGTVEGEIESLAQVELEVEEVCHQEVCRIEGTQ